MFELAILNGQVWLEGQWQRQNLAVKDGLIAQVTPGVPAAKTQFNAEGAYVLPGLIDSHVHLCPPGAQNTCSDDFASGSRAAILGGTTTLVDFTGEADCPQAVDALFEKRLQDAAQSSVDYAFHSSFANPQDLPEMVRRSLAHGMPTVKMYTTYAISSNDRQILAMLQRTAEGDVMLNCHSENNQLVYPNITDMAQFSARRPAICELSEVAKLAEMTAYTKGLFYLVHVSCGSTVEMLKTRFADLLNHRFILESCPHYFALDEQVYAQENGKLYTMTPPLRSAAEREKLAQNLGLIRTLSTDHCPFTKRQKQQPLASLPMGIGGLGYSFAQMYRMFGDVVIDAFTKNQAEVHGLWGKGHVAEGQDADLAIFHKIPPTPVEDLRSACDYSVYTGCAETLRFTDVLRRGEWLMQDGKLAICPSKGRYLRRRLQTTS